MFFLNSQMKLEFKHGKTAWIEASKAAILCKNFCEDDEDEQVADDVISCYNCRYRRWTINSFVCYKD